MVVTIRQYKERSRASVPENKPKVKNPEKTPVGPNRPRPVKKIQSHHGAQFFTKYGTSTVLSSSAFHPPSFHCHRVPPGIFPVLPWTEDCPVLFYWALLPNSPRVVIKRVKRRVLCQRRMVHYWSVSGPGTGDCS
jgi:hypothetical protein